MTPKWLSSWTAFSCQTCVLSLAWPFLFAVHVLISFHFNHGKKLPFYNDYYAPQNQSSMFSLVIIVMTATPLFVLCFRYIYMTMNGEVARKHLILPVYAPQTIYKNSHLNELSGLSIDFTSEFLIYK